MADMGRERAFIELFRNPLVRIADAMVEQSVKKNQAVNSLSYRMADAAPFLLLNKCPACFYFLNELLNDFIKSVVPVQMRAPLATPCWRRKTLRILPYFSTLRATTRR